MVDRRIKCGLRGVIALLRNLTVAALLYALIFGLILLLRNPTGVKGKLGIPAFLGKSGPAEILGTTKEGGVLVKFAASSSAVTINPHANVFNRPKSLVVPVDDYLGKRPHVDTEADVALLVDECRGSYLGMEKVRNVFECLKFLETGEDRYYRLPLPEKRASRQDPRQSEYEDADGRSNTLPSYPSESDALAPSKLSLGRCPGPIIPYHTYWTGPATWRLEIFIKSHLYTQNLPCSRLHIWLDEDRHPGAVTRMLTKDPLFARFLPLVDRGDIVLQRWEFPSRIPLPRDEDNTDGRGYYKTPGKPNAKGQVLVADGIMADADGQQWLVLSPKQMTFLPKSVSDALRFIVLHLHGGVFVDIDVLLLRDLRPLVLPYKAHAFAERWAAYPHPGDFSTEVLSLTANSSLSSYLLRGGVRMGLNFHPRVIGRMAWKDGRDGELKMLESAAFDPVWTEAAWQREGRCAVPCLGGYEALFRGRKRSLGVGEWESYDGERLEHVDLDGPSPPPRPDLRGKVEENLESEEESQPHSMPSLADDSDSTSTDTANSNAPQIRALPPLPVSPPESNQKLLLQHQKRTTNNDPQPLHDQLNDASFASFAATSAEEAALRSAGVIADYNLAKDKFPPNNRTLANFFRGGWGVVLREMSFRHPEPSSWLATVEHAHNGFFAGERSNAYGEMWAGPGVMMYNFWPEFV